MPNKKVTVESLLRADDLRGFIQDLGFQPQDVEAMVVTVILKDGNSQTHYTCTNIFEAIGLLAVAHERMIEQCRGGEP
jgi:hypothetical protein